jgi:ABC-type transporter Mla subunit MlaD
MASNTGIEQRLPPAYDIKSPLDLAKLNPAGSDIPEIKEAQDKAFKSVEDLAASLEQRYAQPNWFKVAAGFAKPQLGGFLASLGSASEALGEQQEAQKAIMPTIARMRSEVAAGQLGLAQRTAQDKLLAEYDKKGVPDISELRRIYSLDPTSPVGKSIEKRMEFEQARRAETGFGIELQEKIQKNPSIQIIGDKSYRGIEVPEEQRIAYVNAVNNTIPLGVNPATWATMSFSDRQEAHARAANEMQKQGMEEGQRAAVDAERAHDVLDELTSLRKLATDPALKPLFSLFANGDLFSQVRAFLDKNPGNMNAAVEGIVNSTMEKLRNVDSETRAKADKLFKGIAEVDVRLRGTLNNPTDAATTLSNMRSPNLGNSQAGFVGILDQLGLNSYRDIELNNLRHQKKLTKSDLLSTDEMREFRNKTRELREQLASTPSLDQTPSWFYPGKKAASSAPSAAPSAAPSPAKPSATASRPAERTFEGKTYVLQPDGTYKLKGQ